MVVLAPPPPYFVHLHSKWCILRHLVPSEYKLGSLVIEGKTKRVYNLDSHPAYVLLQSKDRITAGDGDRAHDMKGKAAISTATTSAIFTLLNDCLRMHTAH
jgi:phosphoribosylaminoimidazole-succinocarboxamide synthase